MLAICMPVIIASLKSSLAEAWLAGVGNHDRNRQGRDIAPLAGRELWTQKCCRKTRGSRFAPLVSGRQIVLGGAVNREHCY
jgi:hypothetical protein